LVCQNLRAETHEEATFFAFQYISNGFRRKKSTCSNGSQKMPYMGFEDIFRGIFIPIPRQLYPDLQQR